MKRQNNAKTEVLAKMHGESISISPVIRRDLNGIPQRSLPPIFQNPSPLCNDERAVLTHVVEPTHDDYVMLLRRLRRLLRDEVRAADPSALHDVDQLLQHSPIVNIVRELFAEQHVHAIIRAYREAARGRLSVLTDY